MVTPATALDLERALGADFTKLTPSPVPDAMTLIHRRTCALVEAAVDPATGSGRRALITGEDARLYLQDLLSRLERVQVVLEVLDALQGIPPLVLEVFPRGRRLVLPRLACVVEIRGRRTVDSVRLLDPAASGRALDARLRLLPDRAALLSLFPEARRAGSHCWTLLGGTVGARPVPGGGGYELLDAAALAGALGEMIETLPDVDAADALLDTAFDTLDRSETSDGRGEPVVRWRPLGLHHELLWRRDETHTPRCVATSTTA